MSNSQPTKTLLVCGGRDLRDKALVFEVLSRLHDLNTVGVLIQGGSTGADTLAVKWAREQRGVLVVTHNADWERFGKQAGPLRNKRMLDTHAIDLVVAFPGGRGTENMIAQAVDREVNVARYYRDNGEIKGSVVR